MKRTLLTLILIGMVSVGCVQTNQRVGVGVDGVRQDIRNDCNLLTTERTCISTTVWINDEIVYSDYINASSDSATIAKHKSNAEHIFKNLKQLK